MTKGRARAGAAPRVTTDKRVKQTLMHAEDARWVFVRTAGTLWIRVPSVIAEVACPQRDCRARVGEPCVDWRTRLFSTDAHAVRRYAAATAKKARR